MEENEQSRWDTRGLTGCCVSRGHALLEVPELRLQADADEVALHLALVVPGPAVEAALGLDELLEYVLQPHEPD